MDFDFSDIGDSLKGDIEIAGRKIPKIAVIAGLGGLVAVFILISRSGDKQSSAMKLGDEIEGDAPTSDDGDVTTGNGTSPTDAITPIGDTAGGIGSSDDSQLISDYLQQVQDSLSNSVADQLASIFPSYSEPYIEYAPMGFEGYAQEPLQYGGYDDYSGLGAGIGMQGTVKNIIAAKSPNKISAPNKMSQSINPNKNKPVKQGFVSGVLSGASKLSQLGRNTSKPAGGLVSGVLNSAKQPVKNPGVTNFNRQNISVTAKPQTGVNKVTTSIRNSFANAFKAQEQTKRKQVISNPKSPVVSNPVKSFVQNVSTFKPTYNQVRTNPVKIAPKVSTQVKKFSTGFSTFKKAR